MLYESYLFMSGMHSFSFSYFSCLQNFVAFDPTFCLETFLDCWCNRSNLSVCSTHSLIVAAVDRDPSVNWIASSIALSIHRVLSVSSTLILNWLRLGYYIYPRQTSGFISAFQNFLVVVSSYRESHPTKSFGFSHPLIVSPFLLPFSLISFIFMHFEHIDLGFPMSLCSCIFLEFGRGLYSLMLVGLYFCDFYHIIQLGIEFICENPLVFVL